MSNVSANDRVSIYHWLVLLLASAGWVFDVYEGQIFNITRQPMLNEILAPTPDKETVRYYGDVFLGVFLAGGAIGGVLFGAAADRWGRRPMLIATILTYSVFSGLTFFAQDLWQVAVLRFMVALGVGGEWSVAASLVSEEFPPRFRAQAGGFFHATSVLGTVLAGFAGMAVGAHWRYAYLLGIAPALLVVWIRLQVKEPTSWQRTKETTPASGSLWTLLTHPIWRKRAILGLLLGSIGLGTFWAVTIAGQDLTQKLLLDLGAPEAEAKDKAIFAYSIVETAGGGLGLLAFGPLAAWWGRRRTFLFYQAGAVIVVPIACYLPASYTEMLVVLPFYGFFTLGMHAGYAIYFPELFPTSLRATGAGFCFSGGGRLLAAAFMWFSGWLKALPGMDLRLAVSLLSLLFVAGMVLIIFLPETKDQPLPE